MRSRSLMFISAVLLLTACSVAQLAELPQETSKNLRAVPGFPLLATKTQERFPTPPPPKTPQTICQKDFVIFYFDAQITTPITLCSNSARSAASFFPSSSGTTTHKLTDPRVFTGLEGSSILQPPLICTTSNGPWSAQVTQTKACINTCSNLNELTVVGVPNNVFFAWFGSFEQHPPGFEFVTRPIKVGEDNLDACNEGPIP